MRLFQYLGVKEKKALRLTSDSMKRRLQDHDSTCKHWQFEDLSPGELFQLIDDVDQIEGEYSIKELSFSFCYIYRNIRILLLK